MSWSQPDPSVLSLRLLREVELHGSISSAAEAAGMTQPSASARLRQLERVLGVTLLERGPSGSVLSPDGALVSEWADQVIQAIDRLRAGVAALGGASSPSLRIAASMTIGEHLLPRWLARVHESLLGCGVHLQVANSEEVVGLVRRGFVDLGFIESGHAPDGLRQEVVAVDDLVLVVAPAHELARGQRAITAKELTAARLLLREAGSGTREVLATALDRCRLDLPTPALELASTAALKSAVLGGLGVAVLSRIAVAPELIAGTLVAVDVEDLDLTRKLRAIWIEGYKLPPLGRSLLAVAQEESSAELRKRTVDGI